MTPEEQAEECSYANHLAAQCDCVLSIRDVQCGDLTLNACYVLETLEGKMLYAAKELGPVIERLEWLKLEKQGDIVLPEV